MVERSDPDLRSKGHALEYFFTQVPEGRPDAGHDATVLIDADTVVDPGLLKVFDRALGEGKDWVQGYYTVRNPDASWRTRMMTYAFSLANGVWMLGLDRLGLGVGLKGNGMCFSSAGLRRVPWKAYGLVEDMEFALMLRARGERVRFEPEARVFGEMVSRGGRGPPRSATMGGGPTLAPRQVRRRAGWSRTLGSYRKAIYLLDLFFPPLATLASGLVGGIERASSPPRSPVRPPSSCSLPVHAAWRDLRRSTPSARRPHGVARRYLASLLALPYYIAWKIFVALGGPEGLGPDPSRTADPGLNARLDPGSRTVRLGQRRDRGNNVAGMIEPATGSGKMRDSLARIVTDRGNSRGRSIKSRGDGMPGAGDYRE